MPETRAHGPEVEMMEIAVTVSNGYVYMKIHGRQGTIAMEPSSARALGEILNDCADTADGGVDDDGL